VGVGLALVFGVSKIGMVVTAPRAADDIQRHHVQAGRFLERYYDGEPIGTDQLGYVSLLHDGPITDFAGLGDYEVLQAGAPGPELWAGLAERRGTRVVVVYDAVARRRVPRDWTLAGQLVLDGDSTVAVSQRLQFYATTDDEVAPLQEHLAEFSDDLPPRVELDLNEYAGLQVMRRQLDEREAAGG
jgi:hypothetical protein